MACFSASFIGVPRDGQKERRSIQSRRSQRADESRIAWRAPRRAYAHEAKEGCEENQTEEEARQMNSKPAKYERLAEVSVHQWRGLASCSTLLPEESASHLA